MAIWMTEPVGLGAKHLYDHHHRVDVSCPRKIIKTRSRFPIDAATADWLRLQLRHITSNLSHDTQEWKSVMKHLTVPHGDRFKPNVS